MLFKAMKTATKINRNVSVGSVAYGQYSVVIVLKLKLISSQVWSVYNASYCHLSSSWWSHLTDISLKVFICIFCYFC